MLQRRVEATSGLQPDDKGTKELEKARTNVVNKHEALKAAQKMRDNWTTRVVSTRCSKLATAL